MKKIIALLVLSSFLIALVPTFVAAAADKNALIAEKTKVVKYINVLQVKLKKAKTKTQRMKIQKVINQQQLRLKKLNAQIEAAGAVPVVSKPAQQAMEKPKPMPMKKEAPYTIGADLGLYAGIMALRAEVAIKEPMNIMKGTTARIGAGYAQAGTGQTSVLNNNRKFAFIYVGGSYNLDQLGVSIPGLDKTNLVGAINYVNLTSGQFHGEIGGDVGVAVEKHIDPGCVYGELNYSKLRTGFSPSFTSVGLLVGYKMPFSL